MTPLILLLQGIGVFAVILGLLHFTFPTRFGFVQVLRASNSPTPSFRLLFYYYDVKHSDLLGIVYVMNHCVSYVIVAVGVLDLFAARWLTTFPGSLAAGAIAGFWFTRAITQFYLGRRRGDWLAIIGSQVWAHCTSPRQLSSR